MAPSLPSFPQTLTQPFLFGSCKIVENVKLTVCTVNITMKKLKSNPSTSEVILYAYMFTGSWFRSLQGLASRLWIKIL